MGVRLIYFTALPHPLGGLEPIKAKQCVTGEKYDGIIIPGILFPISEVSAPQVYTNSLCSLSLDTIHSKPYR